MLLIRCFGALDDYFATLLTCRKPGPVPNFYGSNLPVGQHFCLHASYQITGPRDRSSVLTKKITLPSPKPGFDLDLGSSRRSPGGSRGETGTAVFLVPGMIMSQQLSRAAGRAIPRVLFPPPKKVEAMLFAGPVMKAQREQTRLENARPGENIRDIQLDLRPQWLSVA